ncbi:hypothetical protein L1049_013476 [Liquidambar formosana]|uniref:Uncharacterized protein n=1 Tax=Liquidambar formosana TaxID=63359 RepID=A0AAP0RKV9_LIQFO
MHKWGKYQRPNLNLVSSCTASIETEQEKRMPKDDEDSEITFLEKELEASLEKNRSLEKENQELKQEVNRLKAQISSLKAYDSERKSMLWKKLQHSIDGNTDASQQKPTIVVKIPEQSLAGEKLCSMPDLPKSEARKERAGRVPKPPPRPSSATPPSIKEVIGNKVPSAPAPPPPPPRPSKLPAGSKSVRRVPEVMEFYRSLTRRDAHSDNRTNPSGVPACQIF